MVEEHDSFLTSFFDGYFGILLNKINSYSYSTEAQLIIGSVENIIAIAAVNYTEQGRQSSKTIAKKRIIDQLNLSVFSGFELGWQKAMTWLKEELADTYSVSQ